jgi:hypothetical protein
VIVALHKVLVWKSAAMGASWPVSPKNVLGYVCELFDDALASPCAGCRKRDLAVLIRQLPFVLDRKDFVAKAQESLDSGVIHKRLPDVVHLPSFVLPVERMEEGCLVMADGSRRYVDELPVLVAPDSMEFRFDVHAWHFVDGPANDALAADSPDGRIDDDEAFFLALSSMGSEQDALGGAVGLDAATERLHVGKSRVGGDGGEHR